MQVARRLSQAKKTPQPNTGIDHQRRSAICLRMDLITGGFLEQSVKISLFEIRGPMFPVEAATRWEGMASPLRLFAD
jgi:hypothetical protein